MHRLTDLVHHKLHKSSDVTHISDAHGNPSSVNLGQTQCFLWAFGNLTDSVPAKQKQLTPLLAESLDTERIASITCDARHIIVVTRDGIIFLWELGRSLKKISKKQKYANYKHRPESLRAIVTMMRNQLPIVSNFDPMHINTNGNSNSNSNAGVDTLVTNSGTSTNASAPQQPHEMLHQDISKSINKRIFYGSDAVKWLIDHQAATDEHEAIRFCQALLTEGRMECGNKYVHKAAHTQTSFMNSKRGLYYFSDSRKKVATSYMQKFHAVPADPTLRFAVVASNQNYCYSITQDGKLFEWDLKQRALWLKKQFLRRRKQQKLKHRHRRKKTDPSKPSASSEDIDYDDSDGGVDDDEEDATEMDAFDESRSISDPLDSSVSMRLKIIAADTPPTQAQIAAVVPPATPLNTNGGAHKVSMTLNEVHVDSFPSENDEHKSEAPGDDHDHDDNNNECKQQQHDAAEENQAGILAIKDEMAKEQQNYAQSKQSRAEHELCEKQEIQRTVQQIASKWVEPTELFSASAETAQEHENEKEEHEVREETYTHTHTQTTTMTKEERKQLPEMLLLEKLSCRPTQTVIPCMSDKRVLRHVTCGHDFVTVLNDVGQVFSWGNNHHGKLGHGHQHSLTSPTLIEYFNGNDIAIQRVESGFDHSVAICNNGRLYAWGSNRNGKLGIGDCRVNFLTTPKQLQIIKPRYNIEYHEVYIPRTMAQITVDPAQQINRVSADSNNDDDDDDDGQGDAKDETKEVRMTDYEYMLDTYLAHHNDTNVLENDAHICFIEVACGYAHSLTVAAGSGVMYSWGANLCGQLGVNDQNDRYLPTLIAPLVTTSSKQLNPAFGSHSASSVENSHSNVSKQSAVQAPEQPTTKAVIDATANAYAVPPPPPPPPQEAAAEEDILSALHTSAGTNENQVIKVGCGAFHSCALTISSMVFCWGDNSDGQLGIGHTEHTDIITPQLVDYLSGIDTANIACGADFTFAVSDNFMHFQGDYFDPAHQHKLSVRQKHYDRQRRPRGTLPHMPLSATVNGGGGDDHTVLKKMKRHKISNALKGLTTNLQKLKKPKTHSTRVQLPQYRQPGLPSKSPSERRKHQKEIEKYQQIMFEQQQRKIADTEIKSESDNKFEVFTNPDAQDANGGLPTGSKTLFSRDRSSDVHGEQEQKGYTKEDMNRAEHYWRTVVLSSSEFEKHRHSPKLRESVWKVGIPSRLRGKVWPLAIGNALHINQTLYELFETRAKQMQLVQHNDNDNAKKVNNKVEDEQKNKNIEMIGNESTMKYISVDLTRTFPTLSYFQDDGPLNETLHSLLQTYCFFRPDRGYIQGMSYLAANLLLYMDAYNAFVCFCNLLNMPFFHCFLSLDDERMKPRIEIFNGLFQHNEAALFAVFKEHCISPKEYFLDWVISLFTKKLSISVASRVWDVVLIIGEMEIYRCCVAILKCLQKQLLQVDEHDRIRKKLKTLPSTIKEGQIISVMKTIKVPKKWKQHLQKINAQNSI